jgi:hypothetical protein
MVELAKDSRLFYISVPILNISMERQFIMAIIYI